MKRVASLLVGALLLAGCSRVNLGVKGDGIIKTETRAIGDFSKIAVSGAYEVQWSHGQPGLTITTDENVLPHITTTLSGATLTIDADDNLFPSKNTVVVVSSGTLAEARTTGAVTLKATQVAGDALKLECTGASSVTIDGTTGNLEASLTGAGRLNARSLPAKTATVSVTGAANAEVNVSDALKVSVTGAGTVTYSGNPKTVDKTVTGAGTVHARP